MAEVWRAFVGAALELERTGTGGAVTRLPPNRAPNPSPFRPAQRRPAVITPASVPSARQGEAGHVDGGVAFFSPRHKFRAECECSDTIPKLLLNLSWLSCLVADAASKYINLLYLWDVWCVIGTMLMPGGRTAWARLNSSIYVPPPPMQSAIVITAMYELTVSIELLEVLVYKWTDC